METALKDLTEDDRLANRIALAERLLADQKQTRQAMQHAYKTDAHIQKIIAKLKVKNAV